MTQPRHNVPLGRPTVVESLPCLWEIKKLDPLEAILTASSPICSKGLAAATFRLTVPAYERIWTRFLAWTAAASFDPMSLPFPDTISKVIHCRGRRAAAKPSSAAAPAVNNFAESAAELVKNLPLANNGRVRKAPRPARFSFSNPSRVCGRSPAGSRAAVQRSERTTSHEDSCIRSTSDGPPPSPQPQQNRIVKMQSWSKITYYAGFDWAHRSS